MDYRAFLVLLVAAIGLPAIVRDGQWKWRVVTNPVLNLIFWAGWLTSLVVGIILLAI
jgi:hypothetical protein